MIYVIDLDEKLDLSNYVPLLSAERTLKMNRYRLEKDRYLCMLSYLLLRYSLYQEYQKIDLPELDCKSKPKIKESEICFNISHCDNALACVVDTEEVGIDVQDYNETVYEVRSMYLTKQEETMAERSDCLFHKELTRIWTLKEAYGKFYGYGLCYALCETSFDTLKDSDLWQSYLSLKFYSKKCDCYALSVCAKNELAIKHVGLQDIVAFADMLIKERHR